MYQYCFQTFGLFSVILQQEIEEYSSVVFENALVFTEYMEYIANKAGIESVALGSDFDGIGCGLEMEDYSGMERLCEMIEKRFGGDDAERIISGNALRVLSDILN